MPRRSPTRGKEVKIIAAAIAMGPFVIITPLVEDPQETLPLPNTLPATRICLRISYLTTRDIMMLPIFSYYPHQGRTHGTEGLIRTGHSIKFLGDPQMERGV
jgi:hypothetical protein